MRSRRQALSSVALRFALGKRAANNLRKRFRLGVEATAFSCPLCLVGACSARIRAFRISSSLTFVFVLVALWHALTFSFSPLTPFLPSAALQTQCISLPTLFMMPVYDAIVQATPPRFDARVSFWSRKAASGSLHATGQSTIPHWMRCFLQQDESLVPAVPRVGEAK